MTLVSVARAPSAVRRSVAGRAASTASACRTEGSATVVPTDTGALETTTGRWRAPRGRPTPAAGCGTVTGEAAGDGPDDGDDVPVGAPVPVLVAPATGDVLVDGEGLVDDDALVPSVALTPGEAPGEALAPGEAPGDGEPADDEPVAAAVVAWASTRPPLATTYH